MAAANFPAQVFDEWLAPLFLCLHVGSLRCCRLVVRALRRLLPLRPPASLEPVLFAMPEPPRDSSLATVGESSSGDDGGGAVAVAVSVGPTYDGDGPDGGGGGAPPIVTFLLHVLAGQLTGEEERRGGEMLRPSPPSSAFNFCSARYFATAASASLFLCP